MRIVDNFEKFEDIKLDKGEFLFVQIIQRSKDVSTLGANNRTVKFYCIDSIEQLSKFKPEIVQLCESMKVRAYIHYTPRNYESVHVEMISELVSRLKSKQSNRGLKKTFPTACGISYVKEKKTWVVDIDDIDLLDEDDMTYVSEIIYSINKMEPPGGKIKALVPTKSGCHLITTPFNVSVFSKLYPNIDIHKNNPTILYVA